MRQGDDPTAGTDSRICTTIELTSDTGDSFWIQLHQRQLNFQHQDSTKKDEILDSIIKAYPVPADAFRHPGEFMTFDISGFTTEQVDRFVDSLVHEYYVVTSPDAIACRSELL